MATGRMAFFGTASAIIHEAILNRAPIPVGRVNPEIPSKLEEIIAKALEKDRRLRYQHASEIRTDLQRLKRDTESGRSAATSAGSNVPATGKSAARWKMIALIAAVLILGIGIGRWLFYTHKAHALSATDTIVLADFTNTTGDAVFDGALRQGLAVQLEQSPFLSLISEDRIRQTLRLMGQSPDARLTPDIARDLCQRTQSAAVINGSIANLGTQYVLGLKAVNCRTGDSLTEEQVRATGKEQVLSAMDKAAANLRGKLGESLGTIEKFDTPVQQATTPSLEALQAYSLGRNSIAGKSDYLAAVPHLQRAIRLDPNFAMAFASLGVCYSIVGEIGLAAQNVTKAYELRERVSEREKLYIEAHYYDIVTGNLEKAASIYELWAQTYPRDAVPPNNLADLYSRIGRYDKALARSQETLRIDGRGLSYANLAYSYINQNRLQEAQATAEEALGRQFDSLYLHTVFYLLAFLKNDAGEMAHQMAWFAGKSGEGLMLDQEADTAGYSGRLKKAREVRRRAVAAVLRAEEKETAATFEAKAAVGEALFGNAAEARQRAGTALGLSSGQLVQYGAALALATAGNAARAQPLAVDLDKRFPEDTVVQFNFLPTIRAQVALSRNEASKSLVILQAASPYELGVQSTLGFTAALYPVYVRGEAYLAAHQGSEAAAEFQKILDHRGIVLNEPIGALAHLGLARAYVLQDETAKARAAYQDFLTLWKEADPDIPVLMAAKAEYAKLK
jgi:tetratricopeptide (TPR) repeat protein